MSRDSSLDKAIARSKCLKPVQLEAEDTPAARERKILFKNNQTGSKGYEVDDFGVCSRDPNPDPN